MRFVYDDEAMINALTSAGYEIRLENEIFYEKDYHRVLENERSVYKVFYKGEEMCTWAGAGNRRLVEVFEQEFRKRLLGVLFPAM